MKERRSPCLPILLLILVAVCCVVVVLAGRAILVIPDQAAERFGPVSPRLEPFQRIYLAYMLLQNQPISWNQPILSGKSILLRSRWVSRSHPFPTGCMKKV